MPTGDPGAGVAHTRTAPEPPLAVAGRLLLALHAQSVVHHPTQLAYLTARSLAPLTLARFHASVVGRDAVPSNQVGSRPCSCAPSGNARRLWAITHRRVGDLTAPYEGPKRPLARAQWSSTMAVLFSVHCEKYWLT